MDPISKLAKSLALLRRQPAARPSGARGATQKPTGSATSAPAALSRQPAGDVREAVARHIATLTGTREADDEHRVAVFVEQVLLHEFGEGFKRSPQFKQITKRVRQTIASDPQLMQELKTLFSDMASARPDPAGSSSRP